MRKIIIFFCVFALCLMGVKNFDYSLFSVEVNNKEYLAGNEIVDFVAGTYESSNNHKIVINADNTVLYDDTYSLKINSKAKGNTITGKIGTDNKSVTFYQLNDSNIISKAAVTYKHAGVSVTLSEYTVFSFAKEAAVDANGKFELWRSNVKVNTYADLQSAVNASVNGDVVKIASNIDALGGVYVKNKNITIDGNNNTLNGATWLNTLFFVENDATLTVKNLVVEGGATGFEVDKSSINIQKDTSTKIPIKTGSDTGDVKKNFSAIVNKGKFITENSKYNNNYVNGDGAVIYALSGELIIENTEFNHNRATGRGGALNLGRKFYSTETDFPVKSVVINNTKFNGSYSSNGGAIHSLNVGNIDIISSTFKDNTVTGGKGGAILITREGAKDYTNMPDKLGLGDTKMNIDKCLFEGNWVGNDGSAVEDQDAVLKVTNTTFRKNVGIHSTSSIGTLSYSMDGKKIRTLIVDNCWFDNNLGSASILGDHASSNLKFEITNSKFTNNKAVYNEFLIYTSDVDFKNCVFENEHTSRAIIDAISLYTEEEGYRSNTVTLENVQFKNTKYGVTEIMMRNYNDVDEFKKSTLVIKDNVNGKIDVWHGHTLKVDGDYDNVINVGKGTTKENVVINPNSEFTGTINYETDKHVVTLIVNEIEELDGYHWEERRYIYSDTKTFTRKEFFLEHEVSEENYELKYYLDKEFTTPWDYSVNAHMTVYGKWEEHEHKFTDVMLRDNALYEQCECGLLGNKLELVVPEELEYIGNGIEIIVKNNTSIKDTDYTIEYYQLNVDNTWEKINNVPINVGKYKAVLIHDTLSIEEEYEIVAKPVLEEEKEEIVSPPTEDGILVCFILCFLSIIYFTFLMFRKKI